MNGYEHRRIEFVELHGRICTECGLEPRFFHELDDGTVICCKHVHGEEHIDG